MMGAQLPYRRAPSYDPAHPADDGPHPLLIFAVCALLIALAVAMSVCGEPRAPTQLPATVTTDTGEVSIPSDPSDRPEPPTAGRGGGDS